jgi:hypothetical protein
MVKMWIWNKKVGTAFKKMLSSCLKNLVQQLKVTLTPCFSFPSCIIFLKFLFKYIVLFNDKQKNLAIVHLLKLWAHFSSLTNSTNEDLVSSTCTQENSREIHDIECVDYVELMLRQREIEWWQLSVSRAGEKCLKDL